MKHVECVEERRRHHVTLAIMHPTIWHAVRDDPENRPGDWLSILCSAAEGIAANGPTMKRIPTCRACKQALRGATP